jgi:hypothetical protein
MLSVGIDVSKVLIADIIAAPHLGGPTPFVLRKVMKHHRLAPCSTEPPLNKTAHKFGSVTVGEDKPGPHWDDPMWEIGGDGKIESVAVRQRVVPFRVPLVIE